MLELNRLTSEYIETEDRFRLTGEDQEGNALCLWLTQRLALRIVTHIIGSISSSSPEAIQNPSHDNDTNNLLQSSAQEAAKQGFTPQEAVIGSSDSANMLVTEVDINRSEEGVVGFIFKDGNSEDVALGFEPQQLRQWLIIMHGQWLKAEWPETVWPEWITGQTLTDIPESEKLANSSVH
ncbi:MAG: hypothetical protein AB8B95_03920 [Pseudohongiellaceae bacterium]